MFLDFGKITLVLFLLPISVSMQSLQSTSPTQEPSISVKNERQIKRTNETTLGKVQQKRSAVIQRHDFFKQKHNKEQQKRLLPDAEDLNRYASFLQQPKTGIIQLMNDIGCDSSAYILRADEECLDTIPGSSFYSFRKRKYSSSALADLRLSNGLLITDGVYSQNFLVRLGNMPLENVSVNSDGMKFLTEFIPEVDSKKATNQYILLTKGIKIGKFEYIKVFPAFVNTTYAMRLVAYKGKILMRLYGRFLYDALSDDDRSDVILVFRIIRKEKDGITLIWKELERKKAPKIIKSQHQQ